MPNPWDRQPRAVTQLPEGAELACPVCGAPTDSLKQYEYASWVVFYLAGAVWQTAFYRGCPGCVRGIVARRLAYNLVPANLLWPVLLLPWAVGLIVASYRKGHSPALFRTPAPPASAAANEVSWGRVWLIVAMLFCWFPVVGLILAGLAYLVNRNTPGWKRRAALILLAVGGAVHLTIVVLVQLDVLN